MNGLVKNIVIDFFEEKCSEFLLISQSLHNFAESHKDTQGMAILHDCLYRTTLSLSPHVAFNELFPNI